MGNSSLNDFSLVNCAGLLLVTGGFPFYCPQLNEDLMSVVGLLEAALVERPAQITRELPSVLQVLMPLLHSPLAAPCIQKVFLDIGVCLMPKALHHLGTCHYCIAKHRLVCICISSKYSSAFFLVAVLVGHVTLRLLKPECDLDKAWGQEDLNTAAHRTLLLLHNYTVPQRDGKTTGKNRHASFECCISFMLLMMSVFEQTE